MSVNLTKEIKRQNEQAEQFLLNKTAILERKLKEAKDKVAKVNCLVKILRQGCCCIIYWGWRGGWGYRCYCVIFWDFGRGVLLRYIFGGGGVVALYKVGGCYCVIY